jgi:subtilisin-like proprotein convertase family protein/subtilisin family serine protease
MPETAQTYTYRCGEKIVLEKRLDQFVVRALPQELKRIGITDAEQVSASSSRVTTRAIDLEPQMSRSRNVAPTHHAYYMADTHQEFLVTDRLFVTFHEPLSDDQVDVFAGRYGLVKKAAYSDREYLFQLTDHTAMNPVKLVVKLTEEEPLVATAEHDLNHRMSTYQFTVPDDPGYLRQWHLHTRFNDPAFDLRSSSRCEAAWQLLNHFGSADVVVGITDDGCKLDHSDFNAPQKFAGYGYFRGERLVIQSDIDASPGEMYKQGANHGTSCAGVIAGEVNAALTVGAAPGCRLLPIQWESSGPFLLISDSKLLTALNYVADKVDVLSNSWGGVPTNLWPLTVVNRISQLARTGGRRGRGIVFLWAAGNENCPIQHTAAMDVPHSDGWDFRPDGSRVWIGVDTARVFRNNLVGIPGLMHVAALASNAQRSHYSNYGTGVLICAPTNNVHEYRRLTVTGLGITTTTGAAGGVTNLFGGTSSATPLVAGITALTISANPDLTALDVVSILKQTASKDVSFQGYPLTPSAVFDPNPSWDISPIAPFNQGAFGGNDPDGTWSPWFGHGRADAANAVAEARRRAAPPTQQTFRRASAPELNIPDNAPAGVRDTVNFEAAATLSSIKVTVDITHTFVGDLRLTLLAPSGAAAVLHDRNGGNAHNIQRVFELASAPALGALAGQSIQGTWTLHVQDLAAADVGRLNRWELEIQGSQTALVNLEESPGAQIPDNNPNGIERTLTTAEAGRVSEIEASVDITHTFIGDLEVTLISPAGTSVPLHNRSDGPADNLIKTYNSSTTPGLRALRDQPVQGAWKLKIADREAADVGKLNRWALKIALQS